MLSLCKILALSPCCCAVKSHSAAALNLHACALRPICVQTRAKKRRFKFAVVQMCKFTERKRNMFPWLCSTSVLTSFSLAWTKARSAACYVTSPSSYVSAPTALVWGFMWRLLGWCQGPFFGWMIWQKSCFFFICRLTCYIHIDDWAQLKAYLTFYKGPILYPCSDRATNYPKHIIDCKKTAYLAVCSTASCRNVWSSRPAETDALVCFPHLGGGQKQVVIVLISRTGCFSTDFVEHNK